MNESGEGNSKQLLKIIKSTGCSDIKNTVKGRKPKDFSLDALRWLANFVLTSPEDIQAAPKKPIRKK